MRTGVVSIPSMSTRPWCSSDIRKRHIARELFPAPVRPTGTTSKCYRVQYFASRTKPTDSDLLSSIHSEAQPLQDEVPWDGTGQDSRTGDGWDEGTGSELFDQQTQLTNVLLTFWLVLEPDVVEDDLSPLGPSGGRIDDCGC